MLPTSGSKDTDDAKVTNYDPQNRNIVAANVC